MSAPLRAVVLDNDEATGYYMLLFHLWTVLQNTSLGSKVKYHDVLDFLVENIEKYQIFRPGFFEFLKTVFELREAGRLDVIIMYTHQNADFVWNTWSIPALLTNLMARLLIKRVGHILPRRLFDNVLSLPPAEYRIIDSSGFVQKSFDRILNLYPSKPRDIRGILFIDDNATPLRIEADSIPSDKKEPSSWHRVTPYRVGNQYEQFMKLIEEFIVYFRLEPTENDTEIIQHMGFDILQNEMNKREHFDVDEPDHTFTNLEKYIRQKYKSK